MRRWALRQRIAAWSALVTSVALVTFGGVVTYSLYSEQVEMIDDRLITTANLVLARHASGVNIDDTMLEELTTRPKHRRQATVSLLGFVLARSSDGAVLQAKPASLAPAATPWPMRPRPHTRTIDGKRLRIGRFMLGDTTLILAAPMEPADESVQDILGAAAIGFPIVLVVVAAGSWWIARRAMKPISEITHAAAAISADNLSARLREPGTKDEIAALVHVLNAMFDRLQTSFAQTTRFTADAAHELRTPLTILRGQLEDALRTTGLSADQERLLLDLLDETTGLQKIADNLLLLARFDTGKDPLHREPLSLSALLEEAREDAELLAAPRAIEIDAAITPGLRVIGDATMLRRVALNLIDNAIKFNRTGGKVRLRLDPQERSVVFSIGNTGPGIPPGRRAALFARFYRGDEGRNRESGGSGLGLSLCHEIISAHQGTIVLGRAEEDWTEFEVTLPQTGP